MKPEKAINPEPGIPPKVPGKEIPPEKPGSTLFRFRMLYVFAFISVPISVDQVSEPTAHTDARKK